MTRFSPRQKNAAAANHDAAQRIAIVSGFATAAVAAIPGAGPFLALAPAALGAAYGNRAIAQGRIVRDPPRPDYQVPVVVAPVHLNVSFLGDSTFESSLGALALINERAAATARAVVRATERAMGAEQAGEAIHVRERLSEAEAFAQQLTAETHDASELALAARDAVAELPPLGPAIRGERVVLENVLPDETLAGLYRMGVPRGYVTTPLPRDPELEHTLQGDLRDAWLETFSEAAQADRSYAVDLREQLDTGTFWLRDDVLPM